MPLTPTGPGDPSDATADAAGRGMPPAGGYPPPYASAMPVPAGMPPTGMPPTGMLPTGYVGHARATGICMVLYVVTLGIYSWYWLFKVHQEMKDHTGRGAGGLLVVVLWFIPLVSIIVPFLTAGEVSDLYRARGWRQPVSAATGAWVLLPLIGAIIWFVKTNSALNAYWGSSGRP